MDKFSLMNWIEDSVKDIENNVFRTQNEIYLCRMSIYNTVYILTVLIGDYEEKNWRTSYMFQHLVIV